MTSLKRGLNLVMNRDEKSIKNYFKRIKLLKKYDLLYKIHDF